MNNGLMDILGIGLPAILLGLTGLSLMVRKELGPFAGLDSGGKWLLTLALGMGLLAFTMKMAIAVAVTAGAADALIAARPDLTTERQASGGDFPNPAPARPARYVWQALPEQAPAPPDNPTTPEKQALGERLFYETRLSGDGSLSCSSCHDLFAKAGGDGRATARGIHGQRGDRNAPTVWNAAFQSVLFWDGRARSLEEQAKGPILNPVEMGLASAAEAERRLGADAGYRADFARAFGDETVSFERIAQALASFERSLITPDTPFDRFVRGDERALSQAQLRGMALFESVGCILCHRGPNFSDASLLGGQNPLRFFPANPTPYEQQYRLLSDGQRRGIWRVASLRNVALTGPWLHNGSVDRLEEVVRIMASAQLGRSAKLTGWLDAAGGLGRTDRSPLRDQEVADLVAFLQALSSDALVARIKTAGRQP